MEGSQSSCSRPVGRRPKDRSRAETRVKIGPRRTPGGSRLTTRRKSSFRRFSAGTLVRENPVTPVGLAFAHLALGHDAEGSTNLQRAAGCPAVTPLDPDYLSPELVFLDRLAENRGETLPANTTSASSRVCGRDRDVDREFVVETRRKVLQDHVLEDRTKSTHLVCRLTCQRPQPQPTGYLWACPPRSSSSDAQPTRLRESAPPQSTHRRYRHKLRRYPRHRRSSS